MANLVEQLQNIRANNENRIAQLESGRSRVLEKTKDGEHDRTNDMIALLRNQNKDLDRSIDLDRAIALASGS